MASSITMWGAFALAMNLLVSPSAAAPSACSDPQGVQWAIYPNPFGSDPSNPPNYPKFNPTVIKTETPEYNGTTGTIGLKYNGEYDFFFAYGDYNDYVNGQDFIIDHRGYLKPSTTGTYTFTIYNCDDIVEFWHGSKAYSGWKRNNADITYSNSLQPPAPVSYTFKGIKDHYVPIRIVWAQAGGPWNLNATLFDPSGNDLLGGGSSLSSSIVQYSCNPSKAPPFQPYGSET